MSLLREWRGGQARDPETHKPDLVRGTEQGETESQGQYGEIGHYMIIALSVMKTPAL